MTAAPEAGITLVPPRLARRFVRRRRHPVKHAVVLAHRWSSLVLGVLLLVVTTSGVVVLYEPELNRWLRANATTSVPAPMPARTPPLASGQVPLDLAQAFEVIRAHDPEFAPSTVHHSHDAIVAENYDTGRRLTLDPGSGRVVDDYDIHAGAGGAVGWTMRLMYNVHLCMLTCEGEPGYQAWLLAEVPGTQWAGFDGMRVTWGGLLLGVSGLLLLVLAVSGMLLWWPGVGRWAHGLRIRWRKGRYARDYDLHQVIGMIAVPFLLMWAVTGAGFEFGFVGKAWYAALPGEAPGDTFASTPPPAEGAEPKDITPAQALAAARERLGDDGAVTGVEMPAADDPAATYTVWYADGFDPYGHSDYAGDTAIGIDRYSGETALTYGGPGRPVTAQMWQEWNFPTHAGFVVGPWWRLIWLAFGLTPLVLAVTGLSTWLFKRGTRKRRRAAAADRAPSDAVTAGA